MFSDLCRDSKDSVLDEPQLPAHTPKYGMTWIEQFHNLETLVSTPAQNLYWYHIRMLMTALEKILLGGLIKHDAILNHAPAAWLITP